MPRCARALPAPTAHTIRKSPTQLNPLAAVSAETQRSAAERLGTAWVNFPLGLVYDPAASTASRYGHKPKLRSRRMHVAKVSALAVLMMGASTVAWAQSGLQTKPNEPRSPAYQTPNPAGNSGERG